MRDGGRWVRAVQPHLRGKHRVPQLFTLYLFCSLSLRPRQQPREEGPFWKHVLPLLYQTWKKKNPPSFLRFLSIHDSWMCKNRLRGKVNDYFRISLSSTAAHLRLERRVLKLNLTYVNTFINFLTDLSYKSTQSTILLHYPPAARILLVLGCCVGKGGHVFIHKGPKAQPEVAGELAHLVRQLGAQVTDGVQIIFHGKREVHQVVEIHWVVLHLPDLQPERRLLSWMSRWWKEVSWFTQKKQNKTKKTCRSGGRTFCIIYETTFLFQLCLLSCMCNGFPPTLSVQRTHPAAGWERSFEAWSGRRRTGPTPSP